MPPHTSHRGALDIDESFDHVIGNPSAKVEMIEFGDFTCPICRQAHAVVKTTLQQFGDNIRFAFRHFPMNTLRPLAEQAAEAAEAAAAQGKFWAFHDLIFDRPPPRSTDEIVDCARQLGLDQARFEQDMASRRGLTRIRYQINLAQELGVRTSPAFFVNGRLVDVSSNFLELRDVIHGAAGEVG
ncbi:MAG TPA: thioredoxin domain-containing protein [Acidobacteriaceae bacterium]|nr:thioredoxin domain-containing protein [Acidobacteriaceae bacterium]